MSKGRARAKLHAEPWERQPGETEQAFRAFCHYRDAGPARSIAKTAAALGKSKSGQDKLSSDWSWVERLRLWQNEEDRIRAAELHTTQRAMVKRHREIAEASIDVLTCLPTELARRLDPTNTKDPLDVKAIPARELIRLNQLNAVAFKAYVDTARVSAGLHTGKQEVTGADGKPLVGDNLADMLLATFSRLPRAPVEPGLPPVDEPHNSASERGAPDVEKSAETAKK